MEIVTRSDNYLDEETARRFTERIRTLVDGSVRAAIYYCEDARTMLYIRRDIAEQYSEAEVQAAVDDLALEAFGDPARLTELYRLGDLEATARWFEKGVLVHFPYDDASGLAVSFDHGIGSALHTVLSTGTAYLDDR
ncbi:hypothetical protein BRC82_01910 [Halobacteriales archaeon QS_1_67_19]|nr:MAG: hypothetical protein BRC82_01910 [Halobacteriales archaeon QS_1_67_19]